MFDPTPDTDKLKAELLKMQERKVEIEALLDAMAWPEGDMRVEDPDEASKLRDIGFYSFWQPSSMNC